MKSSEAQFDVIAVILHKNGTNFANICDWSSILISSIQMSDEEFESFYSVTRENVYKSISEANTKIVNMLHSMETDTISGKTVLNKNLSGETTPEEEEEYHTKGYITTNKA